MKIIFLDVDGVLNTEHIFLDQTRVSKWLKMTTVDMRKDQVLSIHLQNLKNLLDSTNAKIVLSSDWRTADSAMIALRSRMEQFDIKPWFSVTRSYNKSMKSLGWPHKMSVRHPRGMEIHAWLERWSGEEIESFAIVDDNTIVGRYDREELSYLKEHTVYTDPYEGLTSEKVERLVEILCPGMQKVKRPL